MNSYGWSIVSQPYIGITRIQTEPVKMPTPIYTPLLSINDTIHITLTGLTQFEQTGGSPIDSYYIEYSIDNTNVWTEIQGATQYTLNLEINLGGFVLG